MNSKQVVKKLFTLSQRSFAFSLYNYSNKSNPRVFMTLSKNGQVLGDLVFELYQDHCPHTTDNFLSLCSGNGHDSKTIQGTVFTNGFPGIAMHGKKVG